MLKQIILSQLRHTVTLAAGALVAHGLTNDSGAQQFTGAIMALAGLAWSIADKYLRARFPEAQPEADAAGKSVTTNTSAQ